MQVASVSCGAEHSGAISGNGQLFCWGKNRHGELGMESYARAVVPRVYFCDILRMYNIYAQESSPTPVHDLLDDVVSLVACGAEHSVCVTQAGDLYQWGKAGNFLHQRPYKINLMSVGELVGSVVSLACGHGFTAAVCRCCVRALECYVRVYPRLRTCVCVCARVYSFTAAFCSDGRVLAWGRTDKGQVGVTKGLKFVASTQVWEGGGGVRCTCTGRCSLCSSAPSPPPPPSLRLRDNRVSTP